MGFFNNILGGGVAAPQQPQPVSLSKEQRAEKISLKKNEVHSICLQKAPLNGLSARVALVLDYSGSMSRLYRDGTVQSVVESILPIAMEFDDNGEMEVWIFENGFHRLPPVSLNNFYDYINNVVMNKYRMGGTSYAPVIKDIKKYYMQEAPANIPSYVVFITDGDNNDHGDTTAAIKDISQYPIFFQFVGIGRESFNYLQKLDDMSGRYVDNADFFKVDSPSSIQLADLLNEFPGWLSSPQVRGMLGW